MRFLVTLLLLAQASIVWSSGLKASKVDSLIQALSPKEKVRQLVWLQVENDQGFSELDPKVIQSYGGIYLNHPFKAFDEYIYNRGFIPALAVQLDDRLNPVPEGLQNLPTITTLSSISDDALLAEYFNFLKQASLSYGIHYLVLPDIDPTRTQAGQLLDKMVAHDPGYFVPKGSVQFEFVKRRKAVKSLFTGSDHWAVMPEEIERLDKVIDKHGKRMDLRFVEASIRQSVVHKYGNQSYELKRKLSNKLAVKISRASIVPLQKTPGILPLKADTICLVTDDPFSPMAQIISKYAYLITSEQGIQNSQSPIVIDDLYTSLEPFRVQDRQVIFLGSIRNGMEYGTRIDAALFTSTYNEMYAYLLPQLMFGIANASGTMPVALGAFSEYSNEPIHGLDVLGYAPPEMAGLDESVRRKIRSIVQEAINTGSTPGCQLGVAVGGSILMEEGFGHLTYDSLIPTDRNTIYDLASVTKVTGTLLAIMKLYEEGGIALDSPISNYLPKFLGSNKENITVRQLLSHNAGLLSYVPFWKRTLGGPDRLETFYYESAEEEQADKRSYGMHPSPALRDSLNNWIVKSPLVRYDSLPGYRYSDIGFMILHQIVETVSGMRMDQYLNENFYAHLQLENLKFNPMTQGISRFEIAPTEYDFYFRDEQVWGEVHDRNAAVFGGVAGHAGLFANTHDLLILLQMIAQEGHYGNQQFLKPSTIAYFNQRYFPDNRRALGWDKKGVKFSNASINASENSFGHTGFTGTMVWVDPEFDLVFVFLSNRIYPDANNYKLIQNDIRTRIQDVVYEAILSKWVN